MNRLNENKKCILVNNGNPYILQHFPKFRNIIVAFEDLPLYNQLAAEALMGAYNTKGRLPVSVTDSFPLGSGKQTIALDRFEYLVEFVLRRIKFGRLE